MEQGARNWGEEGGARKQLIDDLTQLKKVSNNKLDENDLKMKFAKTLVFLKHEWSNKFELNEEEKSELSECLKGKKNY